MRPGATSNDTPSSATMPPKRTPTCSTLSNASPGMIACLHRPPDNVPAKIALPLEDRPRMSDVASYAVRDGIAVITMNNPPVNGLGNALRAGLMDALNKADADPAVKGAVIIGSAKFFSGGADIREFNQKRLPPDLPDVNDRQDAMKKPLVAAIGGFALGGGLELALACHYRVAAPKSQVGLPEVKLGILPGSGGTQRLPRIVPMAEAVRLMTSGAMLPAEKAKELGLVDEIVNGDLLEGAIAFVKKNPPLRRIRDMKARLDGDPKAFFTK